MCHGIASTKQKHDMRAIDEYPCSYEFTCFPTLVPLTIENKPMIKMP